VNFFLWSRRIFRRGLLIYDRGLEFEASLETRVHASCPWGTFCSVAHGRHWACKFDNNFFDILLIQRSWVTESSFESSTWEHMTPNHYFPVRLRFILRSAKIVPAPFCIPSHPQFSSHPLLISRQKNPAKVDSNLHQDMGPRYENFLVRKSSTFRQLPTNQPPDVCL